MDLTRMEMELAAKEEVSNVELVENKVRKLPDRF